MIHLVSTELSLADADRPADASSGRGSMNLAVTLDPIALAHGTYSVALRLWNVARERQLRQLESEHILARRVKIVTPLPYDTRLAANPPVTWESAGA